MTPVNLRVRELREARGWSQRELARRAGVRAATVSHLESGKAKSAGFETLEKLAAALGCDPGYLIVKSGGTR
ncbi:MAG: helix-turn-helix transcriptional regulator [Gemmatimonadetes bacterium]|nr:helix-turn-helix transcriptional regulator [Gemmatimonadota bacterium]